tara:strand:+ start:845 stop:1090 length:246 start_codon:yes stop_codon:yes gene_type:complete
MARISDIHSLIIPAQSANLSAHTYTEIYGGTGGCAIIINGITINVGESSNILISIRSVSGGDGCYLLGENRGVFAGSPNLG